MSTSEMLELNRTIDRLRRAVGSLRTMYGDAASVRRLSNDLERLEIDARDLDASPPNVVHREPVERIKVSDTPYDASMWLGVDDEGLGGLHYERG
ncbi:hypothetical protein Rhow_006592 [Rhodococcus wratislaviensis]|uniref:Uncharacterized protein n=1 Tax=Rhodococcus wratislaviensis TaxID=44752 RepID=A0A402C0U1_RHOWR|nr:hypothetical protein [Rhodococcus wratislaviensis]GCE37182.1 hypothetical protein Rhow_006592 [Rhodococcus wratislaviensis]